jgi:hypothetical protein
MQTTGESSLKQSQDFDDCQSSGVEDDEDFISSPAITLQNTILKCFPLSSLSAMPVKKRHEYEAKRKMRARQNSGHKVPPAGMRLCTSCGVNVCACLDVSVQRLIFSLIVCRVANLCRGAETWAEVQTNLHQLCF